jgi:hypothetical protein
LQCRSAPRRLTGLVSIADSPFACRRNVLNSKFSVESTHFFMRYFLLRGSGYWGGDIGQCGCHAQPANSFFHFPHSQAAMNTALITSSPSVQIKTKEMSKQLVRDSAIDMSADSAAKTAPGNITLVSSAKQAGSRHTRIAELSQKFKRWWSRRRTPVERESSGAPSMHCHANSVRQEGAQIDCKGIEAQAQDMDAECFPSNEIKSSKIQRAARAIADAHPFA